MFNSFNRVHLCHHRIDFQNLPALFITVVATVDVVALGTWSSALCISSFNPWVPRPIYGKSFVLSNLCLFHPLGNLKWNVTVGYSLLPMTLDLDEQMVELSPRIWLSVNYTRVCVLFVVCAFHKREIFIKIESILRLGMCCSHSNHTFQIEVWSQRHRETE